MDYSKVEVVSKEHGKINFAQVETGQRNTLSAQANGRYGSIFVDQIQSENQIIWRSRFIIKENTTLSLTLQDELPGIRLIFTMKNNMRFQVGGFRKGIRLKHQYNLLYTPKADIDYILKKGKEYEALVIFMKLDWLQRWKKSFPELNDFWKEIDLGKSALISKRPLSATTPMLNIIREILNNPHKKDYYIEAKVLEIMYLVTTQFVEENHLPEELNLDLVDIQKIQRAKEFLTEVVARRCTIIELSEEVGLNEFTLKHGFKQLFGLTIHDFITQERMQLSLKLLKETDMDIKEVATATGYSSSHFSKAFKKNFGYSAKSIKKKAA